MRRGNRIAGIILACALMVTALGGCARARSAVVIDATAAQRYEHTTKMTMFGYKADTLNLIAIEKLMHSYMDEREDVIITYEGAKGNAYWEAFMLRAATDNLDDVFMVDQERVNLLSGQGKLADLRDVPGLDNYTDQARAQFIEADGSVHFLPTCISTYNLYINYDLLENYGQKVPENLAEFKAVCDYFKGLGITPIIANDYGSLPTLISGRGLFDTYQQADTASAIAAFDADPDSLVAALRPGIELVREMLDRGWLDAEEVRRTAQTSDDLTLFAMGDRPFMISGGWASVRVKSKGVNFTYGVHPYPILEDGCVLPMQADTCIAVNASSSALAEAKDFVSYIIQPEAMWAYCDSQASYTPLWEEERVPSEETLVPSSTYLSNGRSVMRTDYRMSLPMEGSLRKVCVSLLDGTGVDTACAQLAQLLKEEVSGS